MNIKTKINKELQAELRRLEHVGAEHRSGLVKSGVITLVALIGLSMSESFHAAADFKKHADHTTKRAMVARNITSVVAEKNETVRMPVKFDEGLRAPAITSF